MDQYKWTNKEIVPFAEKKNKKKQTDFTLRLKINTPTSIQQFSLGDYMFLSPSLWCNRNIIFHEFTPPLFFKCNRYAFDFQREFRSQLSFRSPPPAGSFSSISPNKHKIKKAMTNVNRMLSSERSLKTETCQWKEKCSLQTCIQNTKINFFFSQPEKAPIFTIYKGNITPIAARSNIICLNKSKCPCV